MNEWREVSWGEIAQLRYGKGLRDYKEKTEGVPVFGTNGQVGYTDRPLCETDGVVIGRKGAYRGVHYSPNPFYVIDTAFWLEVSDEVHPRWAYFNLKTADINGLDSGSAIPSLSRVDFDSLPCLLPEVLEQRAIAHILGTLDDKIELNQKMNQTLEEIAKAIFKSWFVDFDPVRAKAEGRPTGLPPEISDLFPDELVDSEIGEIPKGWEVAKLAKICETTDYVANGSFSTLKENVSKVESFSGTEAMMLRFADFNRGWAGDFSFVTHDSYEFLSKSKVFCGDIVICNVGEVGAVFRAPDLGFDMTLGPNGVLCKNFESGIGLKREYFYFYLSDKTFRSRIEAISSGSVQTKFNKTDFRNLDVLIPHHELLAVVDPIFEQVCQRLDLLFKENRILSELRDTLLPKLISGELRIPDAEKFLEEAGI